jgi:hypothetical protein
MTIRAKDPKFFIQQVDIEAELLKRATDIANKMVAATMREQQRMSFIPHENKEINLDILADKIAERMKGMRYFGERTKDDVAQETTYRGGFSLDNKPAVVRLDKVEIKGDSKKTTESGESTEDSVNKLMNLEL